jgi:Fe-S oxidoreductase, related to NifB/MoaA family
LKKKENVIIKVEKDSIAEELGIEPGDILVSINGKEVEDVFDYRYLINDEYIEMTIKTIQGEECIAEIEKDYDEDIGIIFESGLMDEAKSCSNKCIFCFIDQLPKGMRETLYFKDDDSRLSFLQGNYATLTNMKQKDIDRVIYYHLSPINISVHTTDMELRKKMLNNKNADKVLIHMQSLADAGIEMNLQIVLCNGINDGDILEKSISDLSKFFPHARSLSVVPIGLTRYREGLYPMKPFEKEDCQAVIDIIEKWQKKLKAEIGSSFVFIADEFYLTAEREFPNVDKYEDFPQIENGVGMISLMKDEFYTYMKELNGDKELKKTVSIATGTAAFEFIDGLCKEIMVKYPRVKIQVFPIINEFFGGKISVSGLLCGCDIISQLKNKDLGDYLCLPQNLLRSGETTLLDDLTIEDIEKELNVKIRIVKESGEDFVKTILD